MLYGGLVVGVFCVGFLFVIILVYDKSNDGMSCIGAWHLWIVLLQSLIWCSFLSCGNTMYYYQESAAQLYV